MCSLLSSCDSLCAGAELEGMFGRLTRSIRQATQPRLSLLNRTSSSRRWYGSAPKTEAEASKLAAEYQRDGYCVVTDLVSKPELAMLKREIAGMSKCTPGFCVCVLWWAARSSHVVVSWCVMDSDCTWRLRFNPRITRCRSNRCSRQCESWRCQIIISNQHSRRR